MAGASIKWQGTKALEAKIRKMVSGSTRAHARIGTNIEHGPFVELGTSKQRAQPYLRPALDEKKEAALKEVSSVLSSGLLHGGMKLRDALYSGGMVIEVAAKIKAPVLTGLLRSTITTEATG